eukprot:TRINITY_DN7554_c0_g1_i1.p1 TRINITY_DN7554_c0_g1~~TRINITY_DN7554_c0_g1_i1.p1  ORF type:complete len:728 (+),score=174.30 TRINITY_DN7554_c0_g1_i1:24-2207(+)
MLLRLTSGLPRARKGRNLGGKVTKWINNTFGQPQPPSPPVATPIPNPISLFSKQLTDDFSWLQTLDRKTRQYISEENMYTNKITKNFEHFGTIYEKLLESDCNELSSCPEFYNGYYYYIRYPTDQDFPLFCRRKETDSTEEVVLDQNELAEKFPYLSVNVLKVSPDQRYLAFTMDIAGDENYGGYIMDLTNHTLLKDRIPLITNLEWFDENTLLYTIPDSLKRPCSVWYHRIGQPTSQDVSIFNEPDDKFFVDILATKDKKYFTININSKTTSEIHLLSAGKSIGKPRLVMPREEGVEYFLDHQHNYFLIITNRCNSQNYQVEIVNENDISDVSKWRVIIPSSDSKIEDIDVFQDNVVLYERHEGLPKIRVLKFKQQAEDLSSIISESYYINLPHPICCIEPGINLNYNSKSLRFSYSSPIIPHKTFDYHFETKTFTILEERKPGTQFEDSDYICKRVHVPSSSNPSIHIPLTITHHKKLKLDASNPLILSGYGAYGHNHEPEYKTENTVLLRSGWIIAHAHVRGGAEMGKAWHHQGRLLHKKNTFQDFMDCAQYLINMGYSKASLMAAVASSAGGLMLGAVLNEMETNLFKSVVAKVPFVDVLSAMTDPSLPLTKHEYDEFGDPLKGSEYFDYILSYDPYHNIKPKAYPNILVTASTMDIRVPYWMPLKWVAKLRQTKTDDNILIIKVSSDTGHHGEGGKHGHLNEATFEISFLMHTLQINNLEEL